ncbi:MAG: hypothetical protein WC375_06010 [Methanomassiliicoccales archaeon]|jgi:hypothetical protein
MSKTNEDLAREIRELREEIKQMKEIVGVLFTMVIESDDEGEEASLFPADMDIPRMNN